MRRFYAWGMLLVVMAGMVGCAPAPAEPAAQAAQNPTGAATAVAQANTAADSEAVEGAVAVVNGEPIMRAEYDAVLQRRQSELNAADAAALQTFVLGTLINQTLTVQAAETMGIRVSAEEVDAEVQTLKDIQDGDEAAFQGWLEQNGYPSEAVFRDELATQLLIGRVRDEVVGDVAEQTTRQVHARHILVGSEAEALDLRQQLIDGASFVELAAQHSNDVTTRDEGGDLGWFAREELLEPKIAEVAFSQPEGTISQPVVTRLGYHIVETLAFDDLPLQPEKQAQVAQAVFDEWLVTQNDSAIIEIYE